MYEIGQGVPQNSKQAVKWYRKAADQGVLKAQVNLGRMYREGRGVPQDFKQAVKWYRGAADQGAAMAQVQLGVMYGRGLGVPQNNLLAHMWLDLAASSSVGKIRDIAVSNREYAAKNMTPEQIAEAEKMAREWQPKNDL